MLQLRPRQTLDHGNRGRLRAHDRRIDEPELTITAEEDAELILVDAA